MTTKPRELPETTQIGLLAQLAYETWRDTPTGSFPNDSHWVKWRAVVEALQQALAQSRAQNGGRKAVAWEILDVANAIKSIWPLSQRPNAKEGFSVRPLIYGDTAAAEQPAKGEGEES